MKTKQHEQQEENKKQAIVFMENRAVGDIIYVLGDLREEKFERDTFEIHELTIKRLEDITNLHTNKIDYTSIRCTMPSYIQWDEETLKTIWEKMNHAKTEQESLEDFTMRIKTQEITLYPFGEHQDTIFFTLIEAKNERLRRLNEEILSLKKQTAWTKAEISAEKKALENLN